MIMPIEIDGEIYLTPVEAMHRIGVSRPTFDRIVKEGRITRYKQGVRQNVYYKQSEVDDLLKMRKAQDDN